MSQTPFQKESNGKFSTCADTGPNACQCNNRYDPHHECPHYQDLDDEGKVIKHVIQGSLLIEAVRFQDVLPFVKKKIEQDVFYLMVPLTE